ncbi:MAG TPA: dihydroxyacetone kinase subunit L [Firmicutes bacterium]|nr:dihydroxyacetone kinase subunit L [Bacillota bacterium]
MILNVEDFRHLFEEWSRVMDKNKDYLIKLDQVAGDGDLGLSMSDGFHAMKEEAENSSIEDIGILLYNAGKTMNSKASSSLGTLISSGFIEAGKVFKGKTEISGCEIGTFLNAFQKGIINRGKAKVGEKTFLDGFDPAVRIMTANHSEEKVGIELRKAAEAAQEGSASTVGMLACWGRAARRGEDSRQILDPGSVVAALLITSLSKYVNEKQ